MDKLPRIGWIGTGVMGFHMCKHLMSKGYNLSVFTRTKSKAEKLLEQGATWTEPQKMAGQVDVLIIMLGYPKDVEEVCLGEKGLVNLMKEGSILVDHTTSKPALAQTIYEQALKKNIHSVDAPVSGGDVGAQTGKLVTMCGGKSEIIEKLTPILNSYSKAVQNNGQAGMGQHTKMTNQIVLAGNMAGVVEGLLYASKMKLDLKKTIETISLGAASSTALTVLGTRMVDGNMNPGFYVEHYIKDMEIALEEASRAGLCLPCLALVKQFYVALKAQGGGRLGTQALIRVLEGMNNHKISNILE